MSEDPTARLLAARGRHLDAKRHLEQCAEAYFGAPQPTAQLANAYEDAQARLLVAQRELKEARIGAAVAAGKGKGAETWNSAIER